MKETPGHIISTFNNLFWLLIDDVIVQRSQLRFSLLQVLRELKNGNEELVLYAKFGQIPKITENKKFFSLRGCKLSCSGCTEYSKMDVSQGMISIPVTLAGSQGIVAHGLHVFSVDEASEFNNPHLDVAFNIPRAAKQEVCFWAIHIIIAQF